MSEQRLRTSRPDMRNHTSPDVETPKTEAERETSPPRWRRLRNMIRTYLADLIYGANDGIVTTLAVVSGVVGAALSARVILILGFANLIADGFSMGASNYLSERTGMKAEERPSRREAARHGAATFLGFVTAGVMPLLAYLIPGLAGDRFVIAVLLALLTLFVVGASRALFTEVRWFRSGLEMFVIGTLAAAVAYGIGVLGSHFVGGQEALP